MQKKIVLVLNMVDEVEKKGGSIDKKNIESLLGIPVVLSFCKKGRGVEEIVDTIN